MFEVFAIICHLSYISKSATEEVCRQQLVYISHNRDKEQHPYDAVKATFLWLQDNPQPIGFYLKGFHFRELNTDQISTI